MFCINGGTLWDVVFGLHYLLFMGFYFMQPIPRGYEAQSHCQEGILVSSSCESPVFSLGSVTADNPQAAGFASEKQDRFVPGHVHNGFMRFHCLEKYNCLKL